MEKLPVQRINPPVHRLSSPKHPHIPVRRANPPVILNRHLIQRLLLHRPSVGLSGAGYGMSDTDYRDLPQQDILDTELSGNVDSNIEEGEVSSDTIDRQDQTEDMTYCEKVRSVRSFMGWNHIPVFESDLSEPDKSNNP